MPVSESHDKNHFALGTKLFLVSDNIYGNNKNILASLCDWTQELVESVLYMCITLPFFLFFFFFFFFLK